MRMGLIGGRAFAGVAGRFPRGSQQGRHLRGAHLCVVVVGEDKLPIVGEIKLPGNRLLSGLWGTWV